MIKPLTGTDLASSKTRAGMSSLGELLPRLIRSYELQAELLKRRAENSGGPRAATSTTCSREADRVQTTFGWND